MKSSLIPSIQVENRIFVCRGRKVMLDRDLAELYGVLTKALNQSVRRNIERFPEDFMFQLNTEELKNWKSQFVTSNREVMGIRKAPLAFTEQGIAMLSSVLKSPRAILVNIQIMRTFTRLREMIESNELLRLKVEAMEKQYDEQFQTVFATIRQLIDDPSDEIPTIGFHL